MILSYADLSHGCSKCLSNLLHRHSPIRESLLRGSAATLPILATIAGSSPPSSVGRNETPLPVPSQPSTAWHGGRLATSKCSTRRLCHSPPRTRIATIWIQFQGLAWGEGRGPPPVAAPARALSSPHLTSNSSASPIASLTQDGSRRQQQPFFSRQRRPKARSKHLCTRK